MNEPIHVSVEQLYKIAFDTLMSFGLTKMNHVMELKYCLLPM
jgi:ribosomal protein L30/L7E